MTARDRELRIYDDIDVDGHQYTVSVLITKCVPAAISTSYGTKWVRA